MHLVRSNILGLAPDRFKNERTQRYTGADQAVPLAAFSDPEQTTLRTLYAFLRDLEGAAMKNDALDPFLANVSLRALSKRVQEIGFGRHLSADIASAAHDLRSGMLSALLLELTFESTQRIPPDDIRALARDCAKLMRNLVASIDPGGRERDLRFRVHSMTDLVASLRSYRGVDEHAPVSLSLFVDEHAEVATSCAELGTIERILFILLDNAGRHAADGQVEVTLAALEADLRVVVTNVLDDASRAEAEALLSLEPTKFYSQFSSTDSGLGLETVAGLVARAYGVQSTTELVARGYVGTKVMTHVFASWFHWPLATPQPI